MNVNINFNEKSGEIDLKTEGGGEYTTSVADGGAPLGDIAQSSNEIDNLDTTEDSGSDNLDIGGPAAWLIQAMSSPSTEEIDLSDSFAGEDIEDGGGGPLE